MEYRIHFCRLHIYEILHTEARTHTCTHTHISMYVFATLSWHIEQNFKDSICVDVCLSARRLYRHILDKIGNYFPINFELLNISIISNEHKPGGE